MIMSKMQLCVCRFKVDETGGVVYVPLQAQALS